MGHGLRGLAVVILAMTGVQCTASQQFKAASEHPEISIPGATRPQVMNILIASMVRDGFILQTTSPSRVVFGYRTKDVGSRLLWGVPFGEAPEARVQYTLTEDVQGVSVVGRAQLVTNPGIGLEPDRIKPWRNAKVGRTMQAVLREVAEQVEEQLVVHSDP